LPLLLKRKKIGALKGGMHVLIIRDTLGEIVRGNYSKKKHLEKKMRRRVQSRRENRRFAKYRARFPLGTSIGEVLIDGVLLQHRGGDGKKVGKKKRTKEGKELKNSRKIIVMAGIPGANLDNMVYSVHNRGELGVQSRKNLE